MVQELAGGALIEVGNSSARLSGLAQRIIVAFMGDVRTQLSPVQEGEIWRVKIVWPNRHVSYVGKFTSERDVDWINAHPNLTEPQIDL